jgi:hypothetical protein
MRCSISQWLHSAVAVKFAKGVGRKKQFEVSILKARLRRLYGHHLLEVSPAILGRLRPDR